MLRLIGLAVSIGLADSLNPSTVGPALYLAAGEHPRRRVIEFTIAVFVVSLAGGALIALGPGQLIRGLVPHPHAQARHIMETAVGAALIFGATILWRFRNQLADREAPDFTRKGKSSAVLGATITAIELPTAFPYFAVIAGVVGSGLGLPRQIAVLVIFNICFVLPLVGIPVILTLAPHHSRRILQRSREFLERRWPIVLATLLFAAGVFVLVLGITGFASRRNRTGRFLRRFRRAIHP